jgi:hypothetical protein
MATERAAVSPGRCLKQSSSRKRAFLPAPLPADKMNIFAATAAKHLVPFLIPQVFDHCKKLLYLRRNTSFRQLSRAVHAYKPQNLPGAIAHAVRLRCGACSPKKTEPKDQGLSERKGGQTLHNLSVTVNHSIRKWLSVNRKPAVAPEETANWPLSCNTLICSDIRRYLGGYGYATGRSGT